MNIKKIRKDFPILKRIVNKKKIVYFDNAATTLKPIQIINAEKEYYEKNCANIHRGLHEMSENATISYEKTREKVAEFVGAKKEEVIFTKNTTESLNLVAYSFMNNNFLKKGDKIVLSEMEHHSNIVPWQFIAKKTGAKIEFVNINNEFEVDFNDLEKKVSGAKIVSFSGASNTIATIPNLKKIEKIVHDNNALFCVDAAQLIAHKKINFKKINADFLAFSGHKMLGPTGIGCLVGKKEFLEKMSPFIFGGDMIKHVSKQKSVFEETPKKFEGGTPNIAGTYSLREAITYLEKVGFDLIKKQEINLKKICLDGMKEISNKEIEFYCNEKKDSSPIILFDYKKIDCHNLAILLNEEGIAIRSGFHCAEPIVKKYNKNGLARASFAFYNNEEEVNYFLNKLKEILKQL
ncbi:MAG: SufS family cysteine desulfurase [Candidatus ainarchaeum sp.]|nr:SufS family cysteine desulfurase [Candidatus ainarchaeum sp.]